MRYSLIGRGRQQHVAGRQPLIVHAPAAVDAEIVADDDDLCARRAAWKTAFESPGEIDPIETQDHVGLAQYVLRIRSERGRAGRSRVQRMISRKGSAEL